MPKITPFLWYDTQALDAANFYVSVFPNSKITTVSHYPKSTEKVSKKPAGSVMTVGFQLDGQDYTAINGGPNFHFNPSISMVVNCETQEEIDFYWDRLRADGGQEVECGWLTDKYGLSWQIVPSVIWTLLEEPERADRVMGEVIQMKKLDMGRLKAA